MWQNEINGKSLIKFIKLLTIKYMKLNWKPTESIRRNAGDYNR